MTLKAALIHLPRSSSACLACQIDFIEGSEYCSVVHSDAISSVKSKADVMQRSDFCLTCWQKLRSENSSQVLGAYWKSRMSASKQPRPKPQKRIETALELLKFADEGEHDEQKGLSDAELFFLALYLARQRQLLFRQEKEKEGQKYQLFEVIETEEILAIKRVDLRKIDLNALQTSLAKRLHEKT